MWNNVTVGLCISVARLFTHHLGAQTIIRDSILYGGNSNGNGNGDGDGDGDD